MTEGNWEVYGGFGRRRGWRSQCKHGRSEACVVVTRSGTYQLMRQCDYCRHIVAPTPEMRGKYKGTVKEKVEAGLLRIAGDYRSPVLACERCGSTSGVELHHWAPRALFLDADEWPQSFLCPPCHQFWHNIATPDLAAIGTFRGVI